MILTRLTAEGQPIGYVVSVLVQSNPFFNKEFGLAGTDQLHVAHFIVDESLITQLEQARQKSQSILDPIDTADKQLSENLPRLDSKEDLDIGYDRISFVVIGPEDPSKPGLIPDAYEDRIYIDADKYGSGLTDPATKKEMLEAMYDHLEERYFLSWFIKVKPLSP